ncbi:MAG TPA: ABC transporter substrate-binding protein [Chloroflexota bacterium]|nr:ABC transporter substrate-binding protein [Chloroflexota bacterium]
MLKLSYVLVAALLLSACVPTPAVQPTQPPLRTVRFMAGYKPQANLPFVAVYVAQANGYFAQQGLQAEITHASGQGEHLKLLLQGTLDVTTASGDEVLARRADDVPVVAFAVLGQRDQRAYAVLESSPIRTLKDWEGRTIGFKVEPAPDYLAMLAAAGVDRARIQEVPVGFDPRLLAAGKVDVYPVFESNEPDTLQRIGAAVRLFRPGEFGVPGLGLTFETRQALLESDPDLLARFLKATLHAVEWTRDHREEATDIIMQWAPQEDRAHQRAMLDVELDMADSAVTRERGLGWASREQWQAFHDSLLRFGGVSKPVAVETAFSDAILQRIYADNRLQWP